MKQILISGIIGQEYTYSDFLTDFAATNGEPIRLMIDSPGGVVEDGEAISEFIRKKQSQFISVTNSGDVASIAASIFLSLPKEKRFFDVSKGIFLIHNPFVDPFSLAFADTTSAGLELIADQLSEVESRIASHIVRQTGADVDVIKGLMKVNEPLTQEQITALNIAQVIKYQAVALFKNSIQMKQEEVKSMIEQENKTLLDSIKAWFKRTTKFVAILLSDADGRQIEFPDVAEGTSPIVGDSARYADGGTPDGEVVMADGSTYVFSGGVIAEIIPVATEPEATDAEVTETESEVVAEVVVEAETTETTEPAEPAAVAELREQMQTLALERERLENEVRDLKAKIVSVAVLPEPTEAPKAETKTAKKARPLAEIRK